jgi:hypothetical protein
VDVFKLPTVSAYEDIKERAIQSTKSYVLIDSILGTRQGGGMNRPQGNQGGFHRGAFQSFQNFANNPNATPH